MRSAKRTPCAAAAVRRSASNRSGFSRRRRGCDASWVRAAAGAMSEGLICPQCTVKLANINELAAHVKVCGSLVVDDNQSASVKSQQRVWQDACAQLHAGNISYEHYARVLGPKMFDRRHWKCQALSDKKSRVGVRAAPSDAGPKLRVLKEGEILFEIDHVFKDHRTWIKFFDTERNALGWVANTSKLGRTIRLVETRHPKPAGWVHHAHSPMKTKPIVREKPVPQKVVHPADVYKAGLVSCAAPSRARSACLRAFFLREWLLFLFVDSIWAFARTKRGRRRRILP